MSYKPVNRMIVVDLGEEEEQEQSMVLLPEGVKPPERYGIGIVKSIANDCNINVSEGDEIIFESAMLQTVPVGDDELNMVLENYVLAVTSE